MAHYAEDDFYQQEAEEPYDNQMKERLVQALGHHVQESVNQALIEALKPFTQPLVHFGQRELMSGPSDARVPDTAIAGMNRTQRGSGGPKSSAAILSQMASSVLRDHEYEQDMFEIPSGLHSQNILSQEDSQSSAAHTSDSERSCDESKKSGKRKRKSHHAADETLVHENLFFDPESIIHPRSTEWIPSVEVAQYVQDTLRKGFDKDVHSTLRSECPCPSLLGKVDDTPELDPSMATLRYSQRKD
ncbi:hypothetical protein NDU88_006728 [Pleurodeles waltl]|uniref:Uncharacterized protein n=1 Tax=Pleurodeles waltl TaxID=8319 RepID=A0AAV7WBE5_PLEWA|nr:hypothetical protein NDU88_006728 [Pleurodeles waltl]